MFRMQITNRLSNEQCQIFRIVRLTNKVNHEANADVDSVSGIHSIYTGRHWCWQQLMAYKIYENSIFLYKSESL